MIHLKKPLFLSDANKKYSAVPAFLQVIFASFLYKTFKL